MNRVIALPIRAQFEKRLKIVSYQQNIVLATL
jgi:hypothetical protein